MKINHLAVWAKDLDLLKNFYREYFGARVNDKYVNERKGFESYFLEFSNEVRLELMRMPSVPPSQNDPLRQFTGFIHLAFSVGSEEAVDSLTARLSREGFTVLDGPRKTGDGYYESTVLDPENNRIEITV